MKKSLMSTLLALSICLSEPTASRAAEENRLIDKTLVVWVSPANLTQSGGSALTVNDTTIDRFDGLVFGELQPQVWMPGSNGYSRSHQEQADWAKETVDADQFVQMAIVYRGQEVTVYRDGQLYGAYTAQGQPYAFGEQTAVLFGPRHLSKGVDCFLGRIRDARIYAQPLEQETIASMRPGEPLEGVEPWAWWDFAATGTYDRYSLAGPKPTSRWRRSSVG